MTASAYKVTVRDSDGDTLLTYEGIVPDVNELDVRRDNGRVELTSGPPGAPVVLDIARDPGGPLELERLRYAEGSKPVTRTID